MDDSDAPTRPPGADPGGSTLPVRTDETWLRALRVRGEPHPDTRHPEPDPETIWVRDARPNSVPTPSPAPVEEPTPRTKDGRVFKSTPPREVQRSRRFGGLRAAVRTLSRERRRILLSMLIVALGVGYLAGSLSLLGRVSQGLADLAGAGTERADLVLEGTVAFDSPLEQVRQLIPDSLRNVVETIPGVLATDPRIDDIAIIVDSTGQPVVPLGITERPTGANWPEVEALNPYRFVGAGAPPIQPDEVVIDHATATAAVISVGDQVLIATKTVPRTFRVTGIVTLGDEELPAGSSLALFPTAVARTMFDRGSDNNSIGIQLTPGADIDEVQQKIEAVLPLGVEVSTGPEFEQHKQTSLAKSFSLITFLLIGFAGLALIVGAFTVANSNALLFARRREGFALLRLVGASPRQILGASAIEAVAVGVVAVIIGVPLGVLIGRLIEAALGSLGTPIPAAGSSVSVGLVVASLVVGIGVTLSTALLPARDAASVDPIVALTRSDDRTSRGLRWFVRLAVWAAIGAVAGFALGWKIDPTISTAGIAAGVGAGALVLLSLLPLALTGLVSITTRLLTGRSPALRSLVALRSRRARSRAAATTAALVMATVVVAGLSTLSASFVASVDEQVAGTLRADLVIDSGTFTRGGLPSALVDDVRSIPGVTAISGVRVGRAFVGTVDTRLAAMSGKDMFQLVDLGGASAPATLGVDGIALAKPLATQLGVSVGQQIPITISNVSEFLTVQAVYDRTSLLLGDAIIDTSVLARTTPSSVDIVALVKIDPKSANATRAAITAAAEQYGVKSVVEPKELIAKRTEILRGFEQVIRWMLLFSVALAVVGVANTLQLSVNERRRELGLLRAVGGSRRQVLRIVMVEAGALSLVGVALGCALGIGGAWATVTALESFGLGVFSVPWLVIAGTAGAAILLAGLGALLPALRASRTGVIEALGDDGNTARGQRARSSRGSSTRGFRRRISSPSLHSQEHQPMVRETPPPARTPVADTGESVTTSEEEMASRCYNCGNDPGPDEHCQFCDAVQIPEPVGMFSTNPIAAGAPAAHVQPPRPPVMGTGLWSTGSGGRVEDAPATRSAAAVDEPSRRIRHQDIIDAAVIEDVTIQSAMDDPADAHANGTSDTYDTPYEATVAPPVEHAPPTRPSMFSNGSAGPAAPPAPSGAPPAPSGAPPAPSAAPPAPSASPPAQPARPAATPAPSAAPPAQPARPAATPAPPSSPFGQSTRPEPAAQNDEHAERRPLFGSTSTPGEPVAPSVADHPADEPTSHPIGSVFDPEISMTASSPFGQHANDDPADAAGSFRPDPEQIQPEPPRWTAPWQPQAGQPVQNQPTPMPAPPPTPSAAPAPPVGHSPQTFGGPVSSSTQITPVPVGASDAQGLSAAIGRLSPASQNAGSVAFTVAGALVGTDELVLVAVQGWSLGMPTVAVLTSGRIIVISERKWTPLVEVFALKTGLTIFGRHVDNTASITFQESDRMVNVDQITDVNLAVELATTARSRATGTGF